MTREIVESLPNRAQAVDYLKKLEAEKAAALEKYPQYPAEMGRLIMKQEELGDKFIKYRHETYSHDVEIDTAYLCTLCDTLHIIQATQAEGGRLSVYQADLPIKDLEAVLDLIKEAKEV